MRYLSRAFPITWETVLIGVILITTLVTRLWNLDARVIREKLATQGIAEDRLNLVRAPAGLDFGAETPGEIALAIVAEMLAVRRKASAMSLSQSAVKQHADH